MQQIQPYAISALFVVGGLVLLIFRRGIANYVIRKNRILYDRVPTIFPPPPANREKLRRLAQELMVVIVGVALIVRALFLLWEALRG
jgi:hypothetical protein